MDDNARSAPSPAQRVEFALVLVVAFAGPVLGSVAALLHPSPSPPVTDAALLASVAMEAVVLAMLGVLLRARGWTRESLGLALRPGDLPWGVALTAGCWLAGALASLALAPAGGAPDTLVAGPLPWASVALASLVNPLFEELFVCGYVVAFLKPWKGVAFAVNASAALRLSYHLYQGTPSLAMIPVGLLFAAWFARTGRLGPVIVAHAVLDAVALGAAGRWT